MAAGMAAIVLSPAPAFADTSLSGPLNLGSATSFSVLGGGTVTNTGSSVLGADLGVYPGTSITGFPPGVFGGTQHATDQVAADAQASLTNAYNVAASLTPTQSGLTDLVGLSLTPGVYSGDALSLSGTLTLQGTAESVWVFQAASTLITGSGSHIILSPGASACNVFWQVGTSATLGSGSVFQGTIMADQSITADSTAAVTGRLLASTAAVTLDSNVIDAPIGCADASGTVVRTSPTIVSGAPTHATQGRPYSHQVTATGGAPSTYAISSGALPAGLTMNSATGLISGTPTSPGMFSFSVTAANGGPPDSTVPYTLTVARAPVVTVPRSLTPTLAVTGADPVDPSFFAFGLVGLGLAVFVARRRVHRADRRP